jgi:NAD(P)H-dependent FMN reductase
MKITIVSGSSRDNSQSLKMANWLKDRLASEHKITDSEVIDLNKLSLTLNPNEFWGGQTESAKAMAKEYKTLGESDAVIIVTPEWGGGAAPALRQFILMSGYSLAHKPILTVGVSSTRTGGIRPVEELKHATKNTRMLIVPEPLVINDVESVFGVSEGNSANEEHQAYITGKADYSITVLLEYAKALKQVRDSGKLNYEEFAFGM